MPNITVVGAEDSVQHKSNDSYLRAVRACVLRLLTHERDEVAQRVPAGLLLVFERCRRRAVRRCDDDGRWRHGRQRRQLLRRRLVMRTAPSDACSGKHDASRH